MDESNGSNKTINDNAKLRSQFNYIGTVSDVVFHEDFENVIRFSVRISVRELFGRK